MAKRFVWRLETVLRHRLRTEDQRQQNLSEALTQLSREQATRAELIGFQNQYREELKSRQTGRLYPADLLQINTYLGDLERKHRETDGRIAQAQQVVAEQRENLAQAVRERQVLENLKDRDYQIYRKVEQKRDQATMDEVASRRNRQTWEDDR